jgi:hypothetical protein
VETKAEHVNFSFFRSTPQRSTLSVCALSKMWRLSAVILKETGAERMEEMGQVDITYRRGAAKTCRDKTDWL